MKEIKFLLPKPALSLREIKPAQWVNLGEFSLLYSQGVNTKNNFKLSY
jgi:hypothetical protein